MFPPTVHDHYYNANEGHEDDEIQNVMHKSSRIISQW